jgi:MarR family transcriptional regulator, organic hydroperoxide resistance regulator
MATTLTQAAIKQAQPFKSRGHEATVAILHTADLVRRRLARTVEPNGITLQQFNVLRILRGGGDAGVATLDVADRMVEQAPGITRLLDRLEAKRLVRRQRCPKDRRQNLCWITSEGRALLEQLDAPVLAASEACVANLSRTDQLALIRLLDSIRAS